MEELDELEVEVRLEEVLERVERGETIAITRRGKRIGRFQPPPASDGGTPSGETTDTQS